MAARAFSRGGDPAYRPQPARPVLFHVAPARAGRDLAADARFPAPRRVLPAALGPRPALFLPVPDDGRRRASVRALLPGLEALVPVRQGALGPFDPVRNAGP